MVTIGINGNEANVAHRVGIGQYAFEVISHLATHASEEIRFRVYLESEPMADFPKASKFWQYEILSHQKLWTLTVLQKRLLWEKVHKVAPDVFFTPTHYTPIHMPVPSVISIMDLSFERFPKYFKKKDLYQLKFWTWLSAKVAKHVITISQFSASEIEKIYHFPKSKITVTPLGSDEKRFKIEMVQATRNKIQTVISKYKIEGKYILFLGTLQPRKNLVRLVEAFSQLEDKEIKLVIVGMINEGRGGWMNAPIFQRVKELGITDRVVFTGFASDDDKPFLMAGAQVYVLPSLYEGFGIPPVEAMSVGVPVVVSKVSSLPEICGEAAEYIDDPYSVASIKNAIENVLKLPEKERQKRIALGKEYVKRYNWKKTAEKTLEVLVRVAQKSI